MPTTEIKTIKPGGGGDYASLNAWYAAEVVNLVAADKIKVAEVYSGGNCLTGQLQMTAWVTDATRYPIIQPAAGEGHLGKYDETKAYGKTNGANLACIENRANFCRIIGMQFKTEGGSVSPAIHQQSSPQGTLVDKCILWASGVGSDSAFRLSGGGGTTRHVVRNTVILGSAPAQSAHCLGSIGIGVVSFLNCTIIGGAVAITSINSATVTTKNCYLSGTTCYSAASGGTFVGGEGDATSTTEASDPALDSVAFSTTNFTNVSASTEDLHIKAASVLVNNGIDTISLGVTEDFTGQLRALPFDIGADELDPTESEDDDSIPPDFKRR